MKHLSLIMLCLLFAFFGTDAAAADGKSIYAEHCAACHGANLEGETVDWRTRDAEGYLPAPPHDASGHTWHHADDQLFYITKHGIKAIAPPGYKSRMIGFGDTLSDNDIWAVLTFIKRSWPEREQAQQRRVSGQ